MNGVKVTKCNHQNSNTEVHKERAQGFLQSWCLLTGLLTFLLHVKKYLI